MSYPAPSTEATHRTIIFHTQGTINPLSWSVMGLHAKENDDSFGRFGTGLKYAISIFLRTGHTIRIHTPENRETPIHEFGLETMNFRGKDLKMITCNGASLNFTTEYGKDWKVWQAYRELYTNTLDEDGLAFEGEAMPQGTSIEVRGPFIGKCCDEHHRYFLSPDIEPDWDNERIRVFKNGTGRVFYKGVLIHQVQSNKDYEFKKYVALTEDRTLMFGLDLEDRLALDVVESDKPDLIMDFVNFEEDSFESRLSYNRQWKDTFKDVIAELEKKSPTLIPKKIRNHIPERGHQVAPRIIENQDYQTMLSKALEFLKIAGFDVAAEIKIVENTDDNLVAYVKNGVIHLTSRSFSNGHRYLCETLLEEHLHTKGHIDCSRGFQDYLLGLVITKSRSLAILRKQIQPESDDPKTDAD